MSLFWGVDASLSACLSPLSVPEPSRHFWQSVWMLLSPVVSSREGKHERQRDWASAFHWCAFTVILFYRTLLWWFRSVSCVSGNGSRSADHYLHSLLCVLLLAPHLSVLHSLRSHTPGVNPQVWYPEHLMIWLRDMSKQAPDRTDSLSCPQSLRDFGSTRVIPFDSWYEGK